jgi:hypothetical protein
MVSVPGSVSVPLWNANGSSITDRGGTVSMAPTAEAV